MKMSVRAAVVWESALPAWCLGLVLAGAGLVLAGAGLGSLNAQTPPAESSATSAGATPKLRREGTELVDQPGKFELLGGRVVFAMADGSARFVGLENLNLQRISRILTGNPDNLDWIVSGTVTEYQGDNYLLVTRAARRTATLDRKVGF